MNQKQEHYRLQKIILNNEYKLDLIGMGFSISMLISGLSNQNPLIWAPSIFTTAYLFPIIFKNTIRTQVYSSKLKIVENKDEFFPLENAERIIIDDSNGLEYLLEKTRKNEIKEWGAVLKTCPDKEKAVIYEILDFEKSKSREFIKKTTKNSLRLDMTKIIQEGYNGLHHYHPAIKGFTGAENFAVSLADKCGSNYWINLLTFNLEENPEIIGFNHRFVYIPSTTDKKELIKATPEQILEYLK